LAELSTFNFFHKYLTKLCTRLLLVEVYFLLELCPGAKVLLCQSLRIDSISSLLYLFIKLFRFEKNLGGILVPVIEKYTEERTSFCPCHCLHVQEVRVLDCVLNGRHSQDNTVVSVGLLHVYTCLNLFRENFFQVIIFLFTFF
jgi:hypothetical protein